MIRLSQKVVETIVSQAFRDAGVRDEHVPFVVEGLLYASMRGIDSHGIRLGPTYLREIDGGRAVACPTLSWTERTPGVRCLDAGAALGMVAGRVAVRATEELAQRCGVGAVSVTNSNHFGAAGYYARTLAERGLVGIAMSNSDALVAPFGGTKPLWGTNPLSIAAPGAHGEIACLDMATSQTSYTKVRLAVRDQANVPRGWVYGQTGHTLEGIIEAGDISALAPLGGYKGHGLAMMVSVLCALLGNAPFDWDLTTLYEPPYDAPRKISHFFLGLDPRAFGHPNHVCGRVTELMNHVRNQPAASECSVRCPGDLEEEAMRDRSENGIPIPDDIFDWLRESDRDGTMASVRN